MANLKQQQFDDFKKFVAMFGGLFKISEEIAAIGSLEAAAKEAGNRLEALRSEEAANRTKADDIIARAKVSAAEIEKEAKSSADQIAAQANATQRAERASHDGLMAKAGNDAQAVLDQKLAAGNRIDAQIAARAGELDKINAQIAAKTAELDAVNAAITDAKSRHASFLQHIADLKARFT